MGSPPKRRDAAPSGSPAFSDRAEAGVLLGAALRDVLARSRSRTPERPYPERLVAGTGPAAVTGDGGPVVFAVPRGGVAVAVGVARALSAHLDVLMVRKIGHPAAPELGLGAIAEDGAGGAAEPYFDAEMLDRVGLTRDDLADVVARERAELARRVAVYTRGTSRPQGRPAASVPVIVVDDGLATGVTARAALRAVRARGVGRPLLAVPVASASAVEAIEKENGEVVTLVTSRRFRSVGEWYADFGQLTDADVLTLLAAVP
jgi:putative phosphoribosyl transferase